MAKIGFFEETEGVKSSTRLYSFGLLLFFVAFNVMWLYLGAILPSENFMLILDFLLIIGIFTPKYLHKLAEMKFGKLNGKE